MRGGGDVIRSLDVTERFREMETELIRFITDAPWESTSAAAASEDAFNDLALRSFRFQCDAIPEYGAYARHLCHGADEVRHWSDIPPVPSSAFKSHDLSAALRDADAPPGGGAAGVVFETSGTTISRPGRVRLGSTRLYEGSLRRSFLRHVLPDGARLHAVVFGPTRAEAPRSSLWFMVDRLVEEFCPAATWIVEGGEPRWERADEILARAAGDRSPVLLLGTTLLLQAYLTRCAREGRRYDLPPGSRAMDTGGAKGTRVNVGRGEIVVALAQVLGIPPTHLVNEYGMAELGSQFYGDGLLAAHELRHARSGLAIPPWVRARSLDPESMRERSDGEPGLLVHYDLANLEIPLAIQTEDIGMREGDRLTLLGRLPEAERRGCSLPFERFLERERVTERER